MKFLTPWRLLLGSGAFVAHVRPSSAFNNPPGVDIWCGKAYRATNASFEPGGWLEEPPRSSSPLLDLRVYPRMSLYIDGEDTASFVVDADFSYTNGFPWPNSISSSDGTSDENDKTPSTLFIDISITDSGEKLVTRQKISAGTKSNELEFSLGSLAPQFAPYDITLQGTTADGRQSFATTTQIYVLPPRAEPGSVAKLDNLYGGILIRDSTSNSSSWTSVLPYSFYISWGGWLESSLDNLETFKAYGYNLIHAVPPYDLDEFEKFAQRCDELGLWIMYDMRHTYQNATAVTEEVNRFKNYKSVLLWYTADEPDGYGHDLNATKISYDLVKSLDPYHPTSLVLNCQNFHYSEYSSGADIILSDVYPIAVNTTFSSEYNTVCNTTYGCCGCDNCIGSLTDVSTRLDLFHQYTSWLGLGTPKSFWGVPQAFGESQFWKRNPTGAEEIVMGILSINHNAKGLVAWIFPTTDDINNAISPLAKIVTAPDVARFVLGAPTIPLKVEGERASLLDVASWTVGKQILVSIVSLDYDTSSETVSISLPKGVKEVAKTAWGSADWEVKDGRLEKQGLGSLEVHILVLDLA